MIYDLQPKLGVATMIGNCRSRREEALTSKSAIDNRQSAIPPICPTSTLETVYHAMVEKAREIAIFCIVNRGKCFAQMEASVLFRYVTFHLLNGTLFVHRDEDGRVRMVVFAWRDDAAEILRRDAAAEPQFAWQVLADGHHGDAILIGQVIGHRRWMPQLFSQVMAHWPDSPRLHLFTHRTRAGGQKLRELSWPVITRFADGRKTSKTEGVGNPK